MSDLRKTKKELVAELEMLRAKLRQLENGHGQIQVPGLSGDNPFLRSAKKFQVVFDNAPIGIFQSTTDGRYITVNPTLATMYGYDSPEDMRCCVTDISSQVYADPTDRSRLKELLEKHGEIRDHEILVRRKDGSFLWTSRNIRTVYDDFGKALYHEGFVVNIDQRKKAEEKYRAIFANSVAGIFRVSLSGRFLDANPAMASILGYDSPEDLMSSVRDITTDVFVPGTVEYKSLNLGELSQGVISYQTKFRKKDGTLITVHLNVRILRGEDTGPCMDGFIKDITEQAEAVDALKEAHKNLGMRVDERTRDLRKSLVQLRREVKERARTEEDLRESEEKFRRITDSAQDAIVMMDDTGSISFWNRAAETIFGYSAQQAQSMDLHGLMAPKQTKGLWEEGFDRFRATGTGPLIGHTRELIAVRSNGEEFPLETSISAVRFKGRWSAIGVLRDITHRKLVEMRLKEAKEAAEAASRLKSDFLSIVSHELRTPLTSVLGFAKIIRKKLERSIEPILPPMDERTDRTWHQVMENMTVIVSEGERLTTLINDVLDLAKLEAHKVEWKMDSHRVRDLVDHSLTATSSLFRHTNVTAQLDVEDGLPEVFCDRDRVIQVLINLIANAVKFTYKGTVTCRARRMGAKVAISVVDTGVGIPPDEVPTIFDKFKQVGDTLTGKPRGTGLGLSICNEIVGQHGGTLKVSSSMGRGSEFSFTLPVTTAECRTHLGKN